MYEVLLYPSAQKDLNALEQEDRARVVAAFEVLQANPWPNGYKKLRGSAGAECRIRVGDYRIVYSVDTDPRRVLVHRIGHRREVYR